MPFACAVASLLAWRSVVAQRALSVVGSVALLGVGVELLAAVRARGILVLQVGNWPAPFGITLAADLLSAMMVLVAGVVAVAVSIFALGSLDEGRERFGYYPLFHVLLMGVCGAFLAGDLFNLYVWFEVMLIASFVLLVLGGERPQLEGGVKYVALNLVSSAVFLAAAGITLRHRRHAQLRRPGAGRGVAATSRRGAHAGDAAARRLRRQGGDLPALLLAAGLVPHAAGGGDDALLRPAHQGRRLRADPRLHPRASPSTPSTQPLLLTVAGLTMVTGVLGAVAQYEMRRLLAFHVVSQIGYLIMGLGLASPLALAGTVFFIVHVTLAKSALFLVGGIAQRLRGSLELDRLGGLYRDHPWVSLLFLVPALALAGIPPLSGFFAKLLLVQAGLAGRHCGDHGHRAGGQPADPVLLVTRIWGEAWKPVQRSRSEVRSQRSEVRSRRSKARRRGSAGRDDALPNPDSWSLAPLLCPFWALAAMTVTIGLGAEAVFALARGAAEQLLDREEYVRAVLGGLP